MIIKPEKRYYFAQCFLYSSILIVNCLMLHEFGSVALAGVIILSVFVGIIGIPYGIVTCRTLQFTDKGCVISILGIRKYIPWSQIVIRQEETFGNAITYPGSYAKKPGAGVVFSTKKKERPWWLGPQEYCALRNPFATVCVVYRGDNSKNIIAAPHIVDRDIFLATLASFGVELNKVEKKGWLG